MQGTGGAENATHTKIPNELTCNLKKGALNRESHGGRC
jgi:hypothetical protein